MVARALLAIAFLAACDPACPIPAPYDPATPTTFVRVPAGETLVHQTWNLEGEWGLTSVDCLEPVLCEARPADLTGASYGYGCLRWDLGDGTHVAFGGHLGVDYHAGYCVPLVLP